MGELYYFDSDYYEPYNYDLYKLGFACFIFVLIVIILIITSSSSSTPHSNPVPIYRYSMRTSRRRR